MRMQSETSILNFGDTSFRRAKYMVEFKELLTLLHKHMIDHDNSWVRDNVSQGNYYLSVLSNTDIFNRNKDEDPAKRGRTLTNSIKKTGLITDKRVLTEVGEAWLNNTIKPADTFEAIFSLSIDNLVFLRQWTKFRFYNPKGDRYFSPFLFTLKFLSKYKEVSQSDYLTILHSIHPSITREKLDNLINDYQRVLNNEITFTEFFSIHIDEAGEDTEEIEEQIEKLLKLPINAEHFHQVFKHGKSQEASGSKYLDFVKALLKYREYNSKENYESLKNSSKNDTVKKGFGNGGLPLRFSTRHNYTIEDFNKENEDSLLLYGSKYQIYETFKNSKRDDLVKEYGDLTSRLLNLTGIISFDNGLVSLPTLSIIKELFVKKDIELVADGSFNDYEKNINSQFYKNITFKEYIGLSKEELKAITSPLVKKYDLDNINQLINYYEADRDHNFTKLLEERFTREATIEILDLIQKRDDQKVLELVTDNTDVPTIMEYITGVAWYHLSEIKPNLRHSLNLSLDANYLPLSHASGKQGDIEIEQNDQVYLLEATLMDMSNQRRNELEPVIRHTTNLAVDNKPKPVLSFFIGNEIDDNVSNIFRACSHITLKHSQNKEEIRGVQIFPLTINELMELLKKNKSDRDILKIINEESIIEPTLILNGWREPIINKILM